MNPNQVRHNGIDFWDNPYDPMHELSIEADGDVHIPLTYQGTKLFFNTRSPTEDELQSCIHISMTSDMPWNPGEVHLG